MASTTFVDQQTTILASWLNDVNTTNYTTVPTLSTTVGSLTTTVSGKAALGANSDITSISGLTTALSVLQGGTGSTTNAGTAYALKGANSDITSLTALASVPTVVTTAINALQTMPPGTIIDFAGASAQIPTGYLLCDGTSLLRAGTYANLFAAIGVLWGSVDGTHFNVPSFAAGEAAVQNAGTVGASTVGEVLAHTHGTPGNASGSGGSAGVGTATGVGGTQTSTVQTPAGGTKNKAAGQYVLKCIKY